MGNAEEQNLYESVKRQICRNIYKEIYPDGSLIPSERKLSEEFGVSRVTIRKALKLLEEEHIIERVQGSGTRVALEYGARQGKMEIITLVAPAQNTFFSKFIDAFQTAAEEKDILILYKQKPQNMSLEKCLYQIYDKNLRNVVLWLEDMELSMDALRKLRGLGMNIVLFDTTFRSNFADAVCLDNGDAIRELLAYFRNEQCQKIGYVGWDEKQVRSVSVREAEVKKEIAEEQCMTIPWEYHKNPDAVPTEIIESCLWKLRFCDAVLYSVAELAIPFEKRAKELELHHKAAAIDDLPGAEELGILTIEQDFHKMAEQVIDCLSRQNRKGSKWKAKTFMVSGNINRRMFDASNRN
ncbi:MAG: GntR family transcriptional regulator [Eubacteriales bacterium]|nr:GntR family transcriptional regulator [Eubacteriales bacterium]